MLARIERSVGPGGHADAIGSEEEAMGQGASSDSGAVATSIFPMLSVRDAAKAIDFYVAAFGATQLRRIEDESGGVVAGLAVDGASFFLADESPENANFSPETLGGSSVRIELVVDDPDTMFQQAVAAGAREVWPVADQPYGWRQGRVEDPYGHHWLIGKPSQTGGWD
jgi:PhnB protein